MTHLIRMIYWKSLPLSACHCMTFSFFFFFLPVYFPLFYSPMLFYFLLFPLLPFFYDSHHLSLHQPIEEVVITQVRSIKASGWQHAWTLRYRVSPDFIITIRLRCWWPGLMGDYSTHLLPCVYHRMIGNHKMPRASIRQPVLKHSVSAAMFTAKN